MQRGHVIQHVKIGDRVSSTACDSRRVNVTIVVEAGEVIEIEKQMT